MSILMPMRCGCYLQIFFFEIFIQLSVYVTSDDRNDNYRVLFPSRSPSHATIVSKLLYDIFHDKLLLLDYV